MPRTDLGESTPHVQPISANALRCIAALACGVSLALTLRLCLGLRTGDDIAATALAGTMAVCWEAAKYVFATVGAVRIRARRPGQVAGGVGLCLLGLGLLIGSVAASLSYLQQHAGELRERALTTSRRFQDLETRLQGMNAEIATLRATAAQDAEHGYRSRALRTLATARQIAQQRDELVAQRNAAADGEVHSAAAAVLQPLAAATGLDATRLQLLVNLAIALLLEAIGIASLLLLRLTPPVAAQARAPMPRCTSPEHVSDASVQPQPDAAAADRAALAQPDAAAARCATAAASDADAYARCRDLIIGGVISPSTRGLQRGLNVGQRKALRFLHALCNDGVLVKAENGRGFRMLMDLA